MIRRRRKIKPDVTERPFLKGVSEEDLAEALKNSGGLQAVAGKMLNISQPAVSQRIKHSPYLQEVVSQVKNELLDLAESELRKQIYRGNIAAIIFYLKTVGKERGFNEKQELDIHANIKGGVLVVPGMAPTAEAWLENRSQKIAENKPLTLNTGEE